MRPACPGLSGTTGSRSPAGPSSTEVRACGAALSLADREEISRARQGSQPDQHRRVARSLGIDGES